MRSETKTIYFDRPGPANTDETIILAKKRALEIGLKKIVIASFSGKTAVKAFEKFGKDFEIICVTNPAGRAFPISSLEHWATYKEIPELREAITIWKREGKTELQTSVPNETEESLRNLGIKLVRGTSPFQSIPHSAAKALGGFSLGDVMLLTLRLLSPGLAVCIECAVMAADAGVISTDEEVIALGGTEQGADTAIVLKPATSIKVFDPVDGLDVREIICKPRSMTGESGLLLEREI